MKFTHSPYWKSLKKLLCSSDHENIRLGCEVIECDQDTEKNKKGFKKSTNLSYPVKQRKHIPLYAFSVEAHLKTDGEMDVVHKFVRPFPCCNHSEDLFRVDLELA